MIQVFVKKDKSIPYIINRKKIKNTYFRVKDDVLVISASSRVSHQAIESFIDKKFNHFYKKLEESKDIIKDDEIIIWGKKYQLKTFYGSFKYEFIDNTLWVDSKIKNISDIKKLIYSSEIKLEINCQMPSIHQIISTKHIDVVPIRVKYLKSKFGSYHRKNHEITINAFLARLEPIYLTYVLFHEYAHVQVFNHSKDFYNLLDELMPNHRVYQKDLKKIAII